MEVHNKLGSGFQEVIYQRAMQYEMELQKLNFTGECHIPIFYKAKPIGSRRVDFLVADKICVELKALTKLEPNHLAQAINYLEAFNLEVGLLINFGNLKLEFHRLQNKKFNPS